MRDERPSTISKRGHRPPRLEDEVLAQVDDRLAHDGRHRQRHQRADDAEQLGPEQQREDDEQRVDAQRVAEDQRRGDVALDLLQRR